TVTIDGRSNTEIKALRLALNRLTEDASWDSQQLRPEFEELIELSFDLDLTAFEHAEINHVLDIQTADPVHDKETIPSVQALAITKLGDIWICGDHRIGCGNPHDGSFVARLHGGALANFSFFNPSLTNFVSQKGSDRHREFFSSGDLTDYLVDALDV